MSSFGCICGAVTPDEDGSPGASYVAYSLPTLNAVEARIAEHVAAFVLTRDGPGRADWLATYFSPGYPLELSDREVIEDIVSRELNENFLPMFRCPVCGRIAVKEGGSDHWTFYRPEHSENA